MLTKTSMLAIRILLHLGAKGRSEPVPPRRLAEAFRESPTYMAKVAGHLVRAGLVRAHRGAMGGIVLDRQPASISLLAVVEACQGTILGDFCQSTSELCDTCAYHQAAAELQQAIVGVLSRWNLAQLMAQPRPRQALAKQLRCFLLTPGPDSSADASGGFVPLGDLQGVKRPGRPARRRGKSDD